MNSPTEKSNWVILPVAFLVTILEFICLGTVAEQLILYFTSPMALVVLKYSIESLMIQFVLYAVYNSLLFFALYKLSREVFYGNFGVIKLGILIMFVIVLHAVSFQHVEMFLTSALSKSSGFGERVVQSIIDLR